MQLDGRGIARGLQAKPQSLRCRSRCRLRFLDIPSRPALLLGSRQPRRRSALSLPPPWGHPRALARHPSRLPAGDKPQHVAGLIDTPSCPPRCSMAPPAGAATAAACLLALLLAGAPSPAAAGCRRRVRTEPLPREEMFFNHQPVPQLPLEQLPKSWDWNDVDGRSMLVGAGAG